VEVFRTRCILHPDDVIWIEIFRGIRLASGGLGGLGRTVGRSVERLDRGRPGRSVERLDRGDDDRTMGARMRDGWM